MSPSNNEHDDKLEQLYHHGANETAPEHLNQKILQASQQAIKSEPDNASFLLRLIQHLLSSRGLAFTAVMVIGISVILQIQFDQPDEILPEAFTDIKQPDQAAMLSADIIHESAESVSPVDQFRAAKPAAAEKIESPAKLAAEKQQAQRLAEEKRTQQILKKKQAELSAQRKVLRQAPASSMAPVDSLISPLQLNTNSPCSERTQAACLASADCTLINTAAQLTCRESINHCEQGFVQATQLARQCTNKPGCQLTPGHCSCDEDQSCQCESNQPPHCQPVENDNEDEN